MEGGGGGGGMQVFLVSKLKFMIFFMYDITMMKHLKIWEQVSEKAYDVVKNL